MKANIDATASGQPDYRDIRAAQAIDTWRRTHYTALFALEASNIIAEYPALAARSAARLDPDAALIDGALGLSGEVDELAAVVWADHRDFVLREAGDVLWYIAVRLLPAFSWSDESAVLRWSFAGIISKIDEYEWVDTRPFYLVRNLIKYKLLMTERVKKAHARACNEDGASYRPSGWAAQLTDNNGPLADEVGYVLWGVYALLKEFGYTLEDACLANIAKLEARHPAGFNAEYAKEQTS